MYVNILIKAQINKLPVVSEFRRGAFGIRRTKSSFSWSLIDLTLEQTDAWNQLTYIILQRRLYKPDKHGHLVTSEGPKLYLLLKSKVGLSKKDDTSHALQKSRIKKDNVSKSSEYH